MPFVSRQQSKWAFATHQPFAKEFADKTDYSSLPQKKEVKEDVPSSYPSIKSPGKLKPEEFKEGITAFVDPSKYVPETDETDVKLPKVVLNHITGHDTPGAGALELRTNPWETDKQATQPHKL